MFGDLTSAFDFASANDSVPTLPSVAAYKPTGTASGSVHPTPPASGSVPSQEPGVRLSRRLGYSFDVAFGADAHNLNIAVQNSGELGTYLQARSLTVAGAPYTYTIGAGDELAVSLANPGTYDLSLHGPNGFYRHYGGSPQTAIKVQEMTRDLLGVVTLRITAGAAGSGRQHPARPVVIDVIDAYGVDRKVKCEGTAEIIVGTRHAGGWYDLSLSAPSDASFSYKLAGRLESGGQLTSDPQLGPS